MALPIAAYDALMILASACSGDACPSSGADTVIVVVVVVLLAVGILRGLVALLGGDDRPRLIPRWSKQATHKTRKTARPGSRRSRAPGSRPLAGCTETRGGSLCSSRPPIRSARRRGSRSPSGTGTEQGERTAAPGESSTLVAPHRQIPNCARLTRALVSATCSAEPDRARAKATNRGSGAPWTSPRPGLE
jgi:hypothetical protein